MTYTESRVGYTAFCSQTERDSAMRILQSHLTPLEWATFNHKSQLNSRQFWKEIPIPVKEVLRRSIERNLYTYIGEMVEKLSGFYTFSYEISTNPDHSPKITSVGDKDTRDILDVFCSSPLYRPHETPDSTTTQRRAARRQDELSGLINAYNHMLKMPTDKLLFWTSPPGDKLDGFSDYSFVYIAKKRVKEAIIDVFSLAINLTDQNHINITNYFSPINPLPQNATRSDILHRATITDSPTTLDNFIAIFNQLVTHTHTKIPSNIINLESSLSAYRDFVESYTQALLDGENASSLQDQIRSFNRQHYNQILTDGFGGSSCGEADFGDESSLPGQKHAENLRSEIFICPACGVLTDPCRGYCHNCSATPDNWRQVKEQLISSRESVGFQPTPISNFKFQTHRPSLSPSQIPHTPPAHPTSPTEIAAPEPYLYFISGLSVLKLHSSLLPFPTVEADMAI